MKQEEYRKHTGISRSELSVLNKSPLHFKYAQEHPEESTPALEFGAASHKYILEEETFFNEYAEAPVVDRRTKEGKETWAKFVEENGDKKVIPGADLEQIKEMKEAIMQNEIAKKLLTDPSARFEESFFWKDEVTGEMCKVRPDCLTEYNGRKMIVDYKTTDSCEDGHFERSCRKYGYKLQAGMYREGVFQNLYDDYGFAFIAQEKKAPYAVRVYICTEEFIQQGYDQFRELIGLYHWCKENDNWFGYEGPEGETTDLVGEGEVE